MLTLYTTECAFDHRDGIYQTLSACLAEQKRAFLIVPEQQTLLVEKEAAGRLDACAPLYVEVTNFSRLSNTAFRTVGGLCRTYSDGTAKAMLMWRTLTACADVLSAKGRREVGGPEVTAALAAVRDMQHRAITPEAMAEASFSDDPAISHRLRAKLHDLSIIASDFHARHDERFSDVGEDVGALADTLTEHPSLFAGVTVIIDGFTSFTEGQLAVIRALLGRTDMQVYLVLPKDRAEVFEYTETRRTAERLCRLADLASVPKRRIPLVGNHRIKDEGLYQISRFLWQPNIKIDKKDLQNTPNVLKIYEADTPYDAAELAASLIKQRVLDGARYNEFAIVTGNVDAARGILDAALDDAHIPYFLSRGRGVVSFEAVKLIDTAYRLILGGYRREDVLAYAKCGLSGIEPEACDVFELYTEKWQIHGEQFLREQPWNMNPDGYTDRWRPDAEAELLDIDRTRRALITPLTVLAERAGVARTLRDHASALVEYMVELHLRASLLARAAELRRRGDEGAAEEHERLFSIVSDVLQHMVDVMGDEPMDARAFHTLLCICFESVEIGRIPPYVDCVTVGQADLIRLADKRHVILFDVAEGTFPPTVRDSGYFTERERRTLYDIGLDREPSEHTAEARALFSFTRAFSSASDTVTLLLARRGAAFRAVPRADIIRHITEITDGVIDVTDATALPLSATVFTPIAALSRLRGRTTDSPEIAALYEALLTTELSAQARIGDQSLYNLSLSLSPASVHALYPADIALTQSRIEEFVGCPLQHFCNYVLHLDEHRHATFDAMNIGTFVHDILEHFFRDAEMHHTPLASIDRAACHARVQELADAYIRRIRSDDLQNTVRIKHFLRRLIHTATVVTEGVLDELRESNFIPHFFELRIEHGRTDAPAPVVCQTSDGQNVYVYGTIDRVDTFKNGKDVYVRVVDYKTGRKAFAPSDLAEGRNLQMFLYLRAVAESESFREVLGVPAEGRVLPAGVIYVGTHLSDKPLSTPNEDAVAAFKAGQTRHGMLLDDPISIGAMNPQYLPIKLKKSGEPDARSAERLYSLEGWEALSQTVSESVTRVAEQMKSGSLPAEPMRRSGGRSTCDWCVYHPVCRNAGRPSRS